MPSTQTPAEQSVLRAHAPPLAHGPHDAPPQSTPVSSPFFRPSVQLGAAQRPESQPPLRQSVGAAHVADSAQPPHAPPQSTSDSSPPFTPSRQDDTTQTRFAQRAVAQSSLVRHAAPFAHGAQSGPPQSTSLSWPFFRASSHSAAGLVLQPAMMTNTSVSRRSIGGSRCSCESHQDTVGRAESAQGAESSSCLHTCSSAARCRPDSRCRSAGTGPWVEARNTGHRCTTPARRTVDCSRRSGVGRPTAQLRSHPEWSRYSLRSPADTLR